VGVVLRVSGRVASDTSSASERGREGHGRGGLNAYRVIERHIGVYSRERAARHRLTCSPAMTQTTTLLPYCGIWFLCGGPRKDMPAMIAHYLFTTLRTLRLFIANVGLARYAERYRRAAFWMPRTV